MKHVSQEPVVNYRNESPERFDESLKAAVF
jgi:hypothetical protein